VQVHYGEGVANHADPESCAAYREVRIMTDVMEAEETEHHCSCGRISRLGRIRRTRRKEGTSTVGAERSSV